MSQLLVFQSLWAMAQLNTPNAPSSEAQKIEWIIDAGFDGISARWFDASSVERIGKYLRGTSLQVEGMCFPRTVDELAKVLDLVARYPVRHLNVQADIRPASLPDCASVVEGWLKLAEQVNYPILFETHRNRLTNSLNFTIDLLRHYPELRLLGDLSHYVVSHEPGLPITSEFQSKISTILERCDAFHGRIATNQQIQVSLEYLHLREWIAMFSAWWEEGFSSWKHRTDPFDELVFTCELGPQPYAIADAQGQDLVDRWQESLSLKKMARAIWSST